MKAEVLNEWVTLIEGDNRAAMELIDRAAVDALISDPPYGMSWNTDSKRFVAGKPGAGRDDWGDIAGDSGLFDPAPWLDFPRVILFGANHFAARLPVGTTLVWLKKSDDTFSTFLSDAEVAWMKGGHGVYVHRCVWRGFVRERGESAVHYHPTQKPVGLMRWCVEKAKVPAGGLILDPFAGSGTTAIAAMLTGRRCVVVESDARYCDVIRRRVERASGDGPGSLFAGQADLQRDFLENLP